jgi:hypothetical protein
MNVFWWEMRFAARALVKRPGFSAAAILTLALALGSTTVIFGFVDGVLLRPLPCADPDRLVAVWEVGERQDPVQWRNPVSPGNFADWKEHNDVFETVAAFGLTQLTSLEGESPERITAGLVTDGFFEVLGRAPNPTRPP